MKATILTMALLLASTSAFAAATTPVANTTNNHITGGSAIGFGNEITQQGQIQGQSMGQSQDLTSTNDNRSSASQANSQASTVNVDNSNRHRIPVATAYAAPLTAGFDTCMGSSSIGGQGVGFGLSVGSTWTDDNCVRLKNSRELASMGFPGAAVALMCGDADVQVAMEAAGTPCGGVSRVIGAATPAQVAQAYAPAPTPRIVMEPVYSKGDRHHKNH